MRATRALTSATIPTMPTLTAGNTVYTHPVAKVMISIPDDLLERLDLRAKEAGETRSGFLRWLAERELEEGERRRQKEVKRLMGEIEATFTEDESRFDVTQLIREDRDSR